MKVFLMKKVPITHLNKGILVNHYCLQTLQQNG